MAVQSSTQITRQQAQALYVIQDTLDASDRRLEEATQGTFIAMQEALEQTQANNRTLAERNAQLSGENGTLKAQLNEMTENSAAQKKAQESSSKAEKDRVKDVAKNTKTDSQQIIDAAQDLIKNQKDIRIARQGHVSPHTEQVYRRIEEKYITDMNQFIELAKKIHEQMNKIS